MVSCEKTPLLCLTPPSNPLAWAVELIPQLSPVLLWDRETRICHSVFEIWELERRLCFLLWRGDARREVTKMLSLGPACGMWARLRCSIAWGWPGWEAVCLWLSGLVPVSSEEACVENEWSETKRDSGRPCSQGRGHLDPLSQLCLLLNQTCTLGESYLSTHKLSHQLSWSFLLTLLMPFSFCVSIFWNSQNSLHFSLSISFINLGPSLC